MMELSVDNPYQVPFIFVADGAAIVLKVCLQGVLDYAGLPEVVGKHRLGIFVRHG
jgi:hypothetical protein